MEEVRKMDKKIELYHGSGQKVEFPEIRKTTYAVPKRSVLLTFH